MTIEEAIKTALQFEHKVQSVYANAAARAGHDKANKVFAVLAREELGHITYLESRLAEWEKTGSLSPEVLETILPSRERIAQAQKKIRSRVSSKPPTAETPELGFLRQALAAENETTAFYERMVAELPPEGQSLFARFVEIERGHAAIVQAEIDAVSGMGFWFDVMEFNLEGS